jgi:murein hydrolase activator
MTFPIKVIFRHYPILEGLLCLMILFFATITSSTQNRDELERNKKRIEQEITLINQLIRETQATAQINLNQLVFINNRINSRENLIRTINNQVAYINRRIKAIQEETDLLQEDLQALKDSYARMILFAHKNQSSYQRMMFIFASRDFNQAYLRMKYLQQLAQHRQLQAQKIEETSQKLRETLVELEKQKQEQQLLLAEHQKEMQQLNQEKQEQNKNIQQLKGKERELMSQLQAQEKAARELQQAIERVLAEERRRAAEAARAQGRPASEAFRLSPEDQIISNQFGENKGKLPWPLEKGIITGLFGEHPHPVLPGIKIVNNGIDISTTQGSKARSIFEGTVSRVVSIPGAHYAIIIRHGDYLSVYSNLIEVTVSNGQKVNVREELGTIATDPRDSKTHIHLEIWHGNQKLNPSDWISKQR